MLLRPSVRAPGLLLVVALLAAACNGGDEPQATSPSPTATPTEIRLGGEDPEDGTAEPSPTAPPNETADPQQETDDEQLEDPATAVATLLEAIEDEDHEAQLESTGGAARTLMLVRDVIRQHNARGGAETEERVEVAREPETTERSANGASVALRSNVLSFVRTDEGTIRSEARIDGPVALEPRSGRWVVLDFVYAGRPLGPGYAVIGKEQTREGVRLEAGALLSYKRTTAVIARLVSESGTDVPVSIREAALEGPEGERADPNQIAVGDGRAPPLFFGFPRTEDRPHAIEVTLERTDDGSTWTYRVELSS